MVEFVRKTLAEKDCTLDATYNDLYYGRLSVNKRSERSSYDSAPVDTPKIGVYLSPGDILNDDIIRNYADIDFDI